MQHDKAVKIICKRLSDSIHREMETRKIKTYTAFAGFFDISQKELNDIIAQHKNDMKLSTILKICENSDTIRIEDLFRPFDDEKTGECTVSLNGETYVGTLKKLKKPKCTL